MELDENAKEIVRELGDAVNSAVSESRRVSRAIEKLRQIGYQSEISLKLEIGLQELSLKDEGVSDEVEYEFTEEDLKTLRKMKINLE